MSLLEIDDLQLAMGAGENERLVLDGVSLKVEKGEIWGIVGETGSGKTLTGLSVPRLVPPASGRYVGGKVLFDGRDILQMPQREVEALRGTRISMIFQDPTTNLNPSFRIGTQLIDVALRAAQHKPDLLNPAHGTRRGAARELAVSMLEKVGVPNARQRMNDYPHQFSGGMRQRVLIAMALIGRPELLIADEPTTALDVSIQAQILRLIHDIVKEFDVGVMFITHNLGVVAQLCTHVAVMNAGRIVEAGTVRQVLKDPQHPYTRKLRAAIPRPGMVRGSLHQLSQGEAFQPVTPIEEQAAAKSDVLLQVHDISKTYTGSRRWPWETPPKLRALDNVGLDVRKGESFGLLGESGSGKSTLARCIMQLEQFDSGTITFDGHDLSFLTKREIRALTAQIQIVFQDPYTSLDPRMRIQDIIAEPMIIHRETVGLSDKQRVDRVVELLEQVGLSSDHLRRLPHQFSGGQRQRIGIARALATNPSFLLLDEPTSALDVSVQAQVLDLLHDLQRRLGLTYLFISHDLSVIRYICDRIALLHHGKVVEVGDTEAVFENPTSDYTKRLLAASPDLDPDRSPFVAR